MLRLSPTYPGGEAAYEILMKELGFLSGPDLGGQPDSRAGRSCGGELDSHRYARRSSDHPHGRDGACDRPQKHDAG